MPVDAETIMLELIIALRETLEKLERRNKLVLPTRCKLETLAQGDDVRSMPEIIFFLTLEHFSLD